MEIRLATLTDMPDIMRLIHEAQAFMATLGIDQWQDGYPGENVLRQDIDKAQLFVLDDSGSIGAVAALSLEPEPVYDALEGGEWRRTGAYLTLHRMALDDAHRGRGTAAQMLEAAEQRAIVHHMDSIRADTHPGNAAMRRFLSRHGFEERGTVLYEVHAGNPLRIAYEKLL